MKIATGILLALLAAPAVVLAQGSTVTTGVNGSGAQLLGTASQSLAGKTVTLTVGNVQQPANPLAVTQGPPAGVDLGSFAAGLSIGKVLGTGAGSTGGTATTLPTAGN